MDEDSDDGEEYEERASGRSQDATWSRREEARMGGGSGRRLREKGGGVGVKGMSGMCACTRRCFCVYLTVAMRLSRAVSCALTRACTIFKSHNHGTVRAEFRARPGRNLRAFKLGQGIQSPSRSLLILLPFPPPPCTHSSGRPTKFGKHVLFECGAAGRVSMWLWL